jgi:hypothetical protein
MARIREPGWQRVGSLDKPGRRSIWVRFGDHRIEICAGREGDDAYIEIEESNPAFLGLVDVFETQLWAIELDEE